MYNLRNDLISVLVCSRICQCRIRGWHKFSEDPDLLTEVPSIPPISNISGNSPVFIRNGSWKWDCINIEYLLIIYICSELWTNFRHLPICAYGYMDSIPCLFGVLSIFYTDLVKIIYYTLSLD